MRLLKWMYKTMVYRTKADYKRQEKQTCGLKVIQAGIELCYDLFVAKRLA